MISLRTFNYSFRRYGLKQTPLLRTYLTTAKPSDDSLPVNKYTVRSHNCGQLTPGDVGKKVKLCGWVQHSRFNNKIILLRDSYGAIQCISDKKSWENETKKLNIFNESVIQVSGTVRKRPAGQQNENLATGQIEVQSDEIRILNTAREDLPILPRDDSLMIATNQNRLKHRYLDLRTPEMQHALRFRSEVCRLIRTKLYKLGFVDCETPTLFSRTPGGANEFIVPTQNRDKFYSLVQSPQQFKQLLMIGGLDRYFQICRCYRDEAGRSDRQPEFTQVDIELSFTSQNDIMKMIEDLMYDLMCNISGHAEMASELTVSFDPVDRSLKRLSYADAISKYGTDKPDLRFDWLIQETDNGISLEIPHELTNQELNSILSIAIDKVPSGHNKPQVETSTRDSSRITTITAMGTTYEARKVLGDIRVQSAKLLEARGVEVYQNRLSFLWIVNFPLFSMDVDGRYQPNHHPFTSPTEDTISMLDEEPLKVIGQHYDLVLNGQEIAGGSIRIHDATLQRKIFSDILHVNSGCFDYFLDALNSGCPPHGGIAIGLDRFIAILLCKESIRDVMAFPKTTTGQDLMTECPQEIDDDVKQLYHLKF